MKTRDKILHKTLELINTNGPTALRIEDLSNSLKLSPGNITYYFPKKGDILRGVHRDYTVEAMQITENMSFKEASLNDFWDYNYRICQVQWKYRGSLLYQMAQIHADAKGKEQDRNDLEYYYKHFKNLLNDYKKSGILETIKPAEALRLRDSNFLIMTTWIMQYIPYAEKGNLDDTLKYYAYLGLKPMEPYFTDKGLKEFHAVQRKYGKRPF